MRDQFDDFPRLSAVADKKTDILPADHSQISVSALCRMQEKSRDTQRGKRRRCFSAHVPRFSKPDNDNSSSTAAYLSSRLRKFRSQAERGSFQSLRFFQKNLLTNFHKLKIGA